MDISKILPLLMNKTGATDDRMSTILSMANGKKPDMASILKMATENKKTAKNIRGLSPIKNIAGNDIIGALTKYFC